MFIGGWLLLNLCGQRPQPLRHSQNAEQPLEHYGDRLLLLYIHYVRCQTYQPELFRHIAIHTAGSVNCRRRGLAFKEMRC